MYPVVVMPYQRREEGYAALGSFFDGANADGTRFSYTQPVVMTYRADVSEGACASVQPGIHVHC